MRIGVFDSGFGGGTVLRELYHAFPFHEYVYFGDNANAPYGEKTPEEIVELTRNGLTYLFEEAGCDLCIAACNTVTIHGKLPKDRVFGVVEVTAAQAAREATYRVGVLATSATITSGAYQRELLSRRPDLSVYSVAAPRLVPLIEQGGDEELLRKYVHEYVGLLQQQQVDTVVLGCTHYPLVRSYVEECFVEPVTIVESGSAFVDGYRTLLSENQATMSSVSFVTSASPEWFAERLGVLFPEFAGMPVSRHMH